MSFCLRLCFTAFFLSLGNYMLLVSSFHKLGNTLGNTFQRCVHSNFGSFRYYGHAKNQARNPRAKPQRITKLSSTNDDDDEEEDDPKTKNRPFSLPPGEFRPKQSLGQNFLSDQNYVIKIVDAFSDSSASGTNVIEIGPGSGALSRVLITRYPNMTAIELDQRAVSFLNKKVPQLRVIQSNVLDVDWAALAAERGGPINIIANLPYYIVSQVLFSLADAHKAIGKAVVTMQLEVAHRLCAKPGCKDYGIPSVVFQLYANPKMNFKIPPNVFYPVPKVDSALVTLDFSRTHPDLHSVHGEQLRRVVTTAFKQRRKMLRASLKELLSKENLVLPEKWATLRPEQLKPEEFLELTADLFGKRKGAISSPQGSKDDKEYYASEYIWRVPGGGILHAENLNDIEEDPISENTNKKQEEIEIEASTSQKKAVGGKRKLLSSRLTRPSKEA